MFTAPRRMVLGIGLLALASMASAQVNPGHVIKVIVPFSAGGISDSIARGVTERMSRELGQTMVIENRPGAGSRIGTETVVRAPGDGLTILFTNTTYSILPTIDASATYDPLKALRPVSIVGTYGLPIVVAAKLPVTTLPEFIAYARKNLGKLSYGSAGIGSGSHFAGEYFKALTNTQMEHIPYKSTTGATADVAAGLVDLSFDATAKPYADAGKVRIVAVTGATRDPRMPSVPTAAEAGLKDFVLDSWVGMLAPPGTPPFVVDRLSRAANTALADPALRKLLADLGVNPVSGSPAAMTAAIQRDMTLYSRIATEAHIKAQP